MISVNQHVGSRIRLYRQMKRYTLAELAEKIHKSKATLSKYETCLFIAPPRFPCDQTNHSTCQGHLR